MNNLLKKSLKLYAVIHFTMNPGSMALVLITFNYIKTVNSKYTYIYCKTEWRRKRSDKLLLQSLYSLLETTNFFLNKRIH